MQELNAAKIGLEEHQRSLTQLESEVADRDVRELSSCRSCLRHLQYPIQKKNFLLMLVDRLVKPTYRSEHLIMNLFEFCDANVGTFEYNIIF